jgi:hypothetical protein
VNETSPEVGAVRQPLPVQVLAVPDADVEQTPPSAVHDVVLVPEYAYVTVAVDPAAPAVGAVNARTGTSSAAPSSATVETRREHLLRMMAPLPQKDGPTVVTPR